MKNLFLFILVTLITVSSFSQEKIAPLKLAIQMNALRADLGYLTLGSDELKPLPARGIAGVLDSYLGIKTTGIQSNYLKKYKVQTQTLLQDMNDLGNGHTAKFFFNEDDSYPVNFAKKEDQTLCLVVSPFCGYETYTSPAGYDKQIAALAISTYILPAIQSVKAQFKLLPFKYFSFSVVYGTKSGDEESKVNVKVVSIVAPISTCYSYNSASITDQQFINKCEVYLSDESSGSANLKKILVTLK